MSLTFAHDEWQQRFENYGWASFESLWELKVDSVEPENIRRGGWSSVARLEAADGSAYYLKRQENHDYRSLDSGFRRTPTVVREWRTAAAFSKIGIGTAATVCLGRDSTGSSRGLLVSEALDEHVALSVVLQNSSATAVERCELWHELARQVRLMHEQGYRHNCLYAQHILCARTASGGWDIRFIDLEKTSRVRRTNRASIGDLSQLERHTDDMSQRDRLWFWDRYFEGVSIRSRRRVLMTIARRSADRGVHQYLRDCENGLRL